MEIKKYIVDTTLRDGEQAPGVLFFKHEKMEIAHKLSVAQIREVEVGTPAMGVEERNEIKAIVDAGYRFRTIAWSRALTQDIDWCYQCKTDAINISFPISDIQLAAMGKNRDWVLTQMKHLVRYAADKFGFIVIGLQDASRADSTFLHDVIATAKNGGVNRIRFADTVGIMNPIGVKSVFESLVSLFPQTDFEFHPHNDLGMATANGITALLSGASGVSCTVNGLGERAGNAALEELVTAWYCTCGGEKLAALDGLKSLSDAVSRCSQQSLSLSKPIVGQNVFSHETGIHVRGLLDNKLAYQPFDESILGGEPCKIVIGKHSGKAAISNFFHQHGISLNAPQLTKISEAILKLAAKTKGGLSPGNIWAVYHTEIVNC